MIVARWSSDMSKSQLCLRTIYVVRALPGAHGVKTLPVILLHTLGTSMQKVYSKIVQRQTAYR